MEKSFAARVYGAVRRIPRGRVATYGQIACLAGSPRAARAVGTVLHRNPLPGVIPCHRVVNRQGRLAPGFAFGGPGVQRRMLEEEGVATGTGGCVDLAAYLWRPENGGAAEARRDWEEQKMEFQAVQQQEQQYLMPTYGRFPVALERGAGVYAYGVDGKRYVDFTSGIGVNALGYCDAGWARAVAEQAGRLQHISNLYYSPVQTALAEMLCQLSGYGKVFFGNSGAEANECAVKLARQYSALHYGPERYEIITLGNSFHGRTLTTLAATGQEAFHRAFTPLTEGFVHAQANSMDDVRAKTNARTCAVLIEFIQGEGGVLPLDPAFVTELAAHCREHGLLLMADEVQTGVGRTGSLYAFQQYGVRPDVLTSAKGLGGGLPIGACLCTEELGEVLGAGMHGSTFGGNPVVCAGALEVLRRVSAPEFLEQVRENGAYLRARLEETPGVAAVRGLGLMLGAALEHGTAKEVASACAAQGLLVLTAKDALRFLPPLVITKEELDEGLAILARVLREAAE